MGAVFLMEVDDWDRRYSDAESVWGLEPNRFVAELAHPLAPGDALDLACGEGRNALWLARQGWRVVAADFSGVALERGRQLALQAGATVDWQQQDVLSWSLPPSDLVLMCYLHLPPAARRQVLTAAVQSVRPGGALLLVGHDRRNLRDGTGGPQDESLLWSPEDLKGTGLNVQELATRPRPAGELTAWDTVGLLTRNSS